MLCSRPSLNDAITKHGDAWKWAASVALLASVWLCCLSGLLGVIPGRPAAMRCDVIFQCDAGTRISDVQNGTNSLSLGSHALLATLWSPVLGSISRLFADPNSAAVMVCRVVAALGAGAGIGVLFGCLRCAGWTLRNCIASLGVVLLSSYQVVACLPDHFAFSSGLLPASFGVFVLANRGIVSIRCARWVLIAAAILAAMICLTNVIWPGMLIAALSGKFRLSPRWWVVSAALGMLMFCVLIIGIQRYGERFPIAWQAKRWLHLRILHDPPGALLRSFRGVVDPVVAPDPFIDTNNDFRVPMLTLDPDSGMPIWPHRGILAVGAISWILLLTRSFKANRCRSARLLSIWIVGNLLFHNIWGDELFLYAPHYGWGLAILPFVANRLGLIDWGLIGVVILAQAASLMGIVLRAGEILS